MTRRINLGAGSHFQSELQRLTRRINRINALQSGRADVTEVSVAETIVRRHVRAAHTRLVIQMNTRKTTRVRR